MGRPCAFQPPQCVPGGADAASVKGHRAYPYRYERVSRGVGRSSPGLLQAYLLHPGCVLDALADAARKGARVRVRLDGQPSADAGGSIRRANAAVLARLCAAGADAALCDAGIEMHMRATVIDGVAYLDDRNFNAHGDTIVRDDSCSDIASLRAAFANRPLPRSRTFWTNKGDALAGEARLLQSARHARRVDVQTESLDAS